MNISAFATRRFVRGVLGVFLAGLPLAYGTYQVWQEWMYRTTVRAVPVFAPLDSGTAPPPGTFRPDAIATVMGLSPQGEQARSAEPLELRASLVASQGASRALLAGANEARFYSVGERLPGGSVLRRVEVTHVVLWRNGREERLALKSAGQYLLPATKATVPKAAPTSTYLRPLAEQP